MFDCDTKTSVAVCTLSNIVAKCDYCKALPTYEKVDGCFLDEEDILCEYRKRMIISFSEDKEDKA